LVNGIQIAGTKLCCDNWHRYADLQDYDLICIDHPLDNSPLAQARLLLGKMSNFK
jgi:hypothetical protein